MAVTRGMDEQEVEHVSAAAGRKESDAQPAPRAALREGLAEKKNPILEYLLCLL